MEEWKKPLLRDCYIESGFLNCVSASAPEQAVRAVRDFYGSIERHPAFAGALTSISAENEVKTLIPSVVAATGALKGWSGYFNANAGYARAAKAVSTLHAECIRLGVQFVTGDAGHAVELLYFEGANPTCVGATTLDGTTHLAEVVILCMGAHAGSLLPSIGAQITAKAWAVGEIQLSESEAESLRGIPVINCRDLGFLFEPDLSTNRLKLCNKGAGYTFFSPENGISLPRDFEGIPSQDEEEMRELLREVLPDLAEREFVKKKMCWCADTRDEEYVIDFMPGTQGLVVVGGDSGHAFKMFPVVGKWVLNLLEGREKVDRWKWKGAEDESDKKTPWRLGEVKDLGDLKQVVV
jgi:sarcosine oxidase/L-pipecolate oxidase